MRTSEVLRQARALIDTPEKWTTTVGFRRRGDGALSYCALGAIRCAASGAVAPYSRHVAEAPAAVSAFERVVGTFGHHFNDTRTHAEVLAAFDRAIANEEAREQEFSATACEPVKAAA